jgi:hypothetical protein
MKKENVRKEDIDVYVYCFVTVTHCSSVHMPLVPVFCFIVAHYASYTLYRVAPCNQVAFIGLTVTDSIDYPLQSPSPQQPSPETTKATPNRRAA